MYGMTPKTLKKCPALWPMYGIMGVGVLWCVVFSTRTFFFNPDGLNPITGKHNWERYRDGTEFKLISFSKQIIPCQAPEYRMPGDPPDDSYAIKSFAK